MAQAAGAGRGSRVVLITLLVILLLLLCGLLIWFLLPILFPPGANNPVANAGGPYVINEGQALTLDGSGSTGNIVTYDWVFGDGNNGTGMSPSHIYEDGPNEYIVTLVVTEGDGDTSSSNSQVTVNNLPPTANVGGPYSCTVGETIQLAGTCDDPGPIDATSLTCVWSEFSGAVASNVSYTCPDTAGDVTVTLTATDKDGASAQDSTTVTVSSGDPTGQNQPPTADIAITLKSKNGLIYTFDGSGSTDPDGNIDSYDWDFGDGNNGIGIQANHEYAAQGTYTVTLMVTDTGGLTDTATIMVP